MSSYKTKFEKPGRRRLRELGSAPARFTVSNGEAYVQQNQGVVIGEALRPSAREDSLEESFQPIVVRLLRRRGDLSGTTTSFSWLTPSAFVYDEDRSEKEGRARPRKGRVRGDLTV